MSAVADRLRSRHAAGLNAFVRHPFFAAMEDGTLTRAARDRYFVNERHFVGAARGVLAHLLIKAPGLASARHLVGMLDGLVNAQEPLFDRIFAALSLSGDVSASPAAHALSDGMTEIARDAPYPAGLAAVWVAEQSYGAIGRRGGWRNAADATLRGWFRLHAEDPFLDGVTWLERELDAVATDVAEATMDRAVARAIALEIDFHADPLQS